MRWNAVVGWNVSVGAAAVIMLGVSAPALAQPTLDEDLGSLTNGATVVRTGHVAANEAPHWYRFTVPALPAASGAGHLYLDIRTTNPSSNTSFISSSIGLYDSAGNLATGAAGSSVDRTDGPGTIAGLSTGGALSYGATCPIRPNVATPPATLNGILFNGRDGALPAGTYYLAFMRDGGTYGASNWAVTPTTLGSVSGTVQLEITLGTTGNPPPILNAAAASPPAVNPGGTTLLTVTSVSCNAEDVPTSMTINLSSVGGSASATMYNDGTHGDVTANDAIWSLSTPITAAPGTYGLTATATNVFGLTATRGVTVIVNGTPNPAIKISQVNGTGLTQSSWAGPTANYVEVHNTGGSAANLSGNAIQVTTSSGTSWGVFPFPTGFTIPAGRYALVQVSAARLPHNDPNDPGDSSATQSPGFLISPDVVGSPSFQLTSSGGKVALTSTQLALAGACPSDPSVVDLVGYGTANCSEGPLALGMNNFDGRALYRGCDGGTDSNNNAADFLLDLSSPRNLASPVNMGALTAVGAPAGASLPNIVQNSAVLLTASATSCAGAPAGVTFTANLSYVGGAAAMPMYDDGTHGDAVAGDGTFSLNYTVPDTLLPAPPPGPTINRPYIVPMTATDGLGRSGHTYGSFYVTAAPTGACCVGGQATVRTQASCTAAGGTYLGDGTSPFQGQGTVYAGEPLSIPTQGTVTGQIQISDGTTISQMVVYLSGIHPYLGDLIVTLSNGTSTVTLFDRVGVAGTNATGRPGNLAFQHIYGWTDVGESFWNAAFNGGKDPSYNEPSGLYAPSGAQNAPSSFAPFIGHPALGTWTLTVTDAAAANSGYLDGWSIEINPTSACTSACTADFNCDGDVGTDADIESFFACLAGTCPAPPCLSTGDFNGDGDVGTDADIEAFFRVLAGGSC
jgi:subtilisin-like proprotein convertase family protein